jgi:hypothetical protein
MARLIAAVTIVVLVAAGLGYYLGWVKFSGSDRPGESSLTVTLDQDKLKHDLSNVRQSTEKLPGRSNTAPNEVTVRGKIERIDVPKQKVTLLTSDRKELTVEVTADTKIRMGEEAARLEDLQPGLTVICQNTSRDGRHVCNILTVEAASSS